MNYWNFSLKSIVSTYRRVCTFWSWDVLGLGRFKAWDVLYVMIWGWDFLGLGTFRGLGRFEAGIFWGWDVLGLGCFEAWDVLRLEYFEAWDVLELGRFVLAHFVGSFVGVLYSPCRNTPIIYWNGPP
jgi:hypothetical protein